MAKFTLLSLLIIIFASCKNAETEIPETPNDSKIENLNKIDCSPFINGQFVYPNLKGVEVSRRDSIQIETNHTKNYVDTYKITWTGECEYYMITTETTDTLNPFGPTDTLFIDIIETTDTSYLYSSRALGQSFDGEMIKVSN
ncbi:MAG: hypothetical protein WDZ35_00895 [Crocinitomicaceae bacterium]